MQKLTKILVLILLSFPGMAQVVFKTSVPLKPVVVGEPFAVQYIIEDIAENDGFTPPAFGTNFQVVSGPYLHHGSVNTPDGVKSLKNIAFTLVALRPGKFIIAGATAEINGKRIKSDEAFVQVISKAQAYEKENNNETVSDYFLRAGEDPYEKMRNNLFMKVMVDKHSCYVGEPVVATFKLYSRLQSRSDIVKNPGFYGFAVQDIVSLDDRVSSTEMINGKAFDVHTVRTVQLYPLQAGEFIIDPMEVLNKVEFSKSAVNKKTEQEIIEGVHEETADAVNTGSTVIYENHLSTDKIAITVKPYPTRNKPTGFTGATGRFSITTAVEKNELAGNEEGDLLVIIKGVGNFTQLGTPVLQWPGGIEGFDASIKDSLDKSHSPLKGSRTFRFPFVASQAGNYIIPSVSLVYFDPDSNNYKTVATKPLNIQVHTRANETTVVTKEEGEIIKSPKTLWITLLALVLPLLIIVAWFFNKKRNRNPVLLDKKKETLPPGPGELLQPAYTALQQNDSRFYTVLQKCIWDYLGLSLKLSGSKMNKSELVKTMQAKGFSKDQSGELLDILHTCEAAAFTKAEFIYDKQGLLSRARQSLELIKT